jgi:hypothetical protein
MLINEDQCNTLSHGKQTRVHDTVHMLMRTRPIVVVITNCLYMLHIYQYILLFLHLYPVIHQLRCITYYCYIAEKL